MSTYKNKGFKRLAIVISGIAFICTYIALCLNKFRVDTNELLIGFPIASAQRHRHIYLNKNNILGNRWI